MTYKLGITGSIASGKSSVAAEFKQAGYPVVDADAIARQVAAPGSDVLAAVQRAFGGVVIQGDGQLNRGALANIVFGNPTELARLNVITQPAIRTEFERQLAAAVATGADIVVGDVPLLFEENYQALFDGVVVATTEADTQLDRLMARDGLTQVQAQRRIDSQLDLARKVERADFAVNTSGPEELRHVQVQQLINHIGTLS